MTCFWDGILSQLNHRERGAVGDTPMALKQYLRDNNMPSTRCMWQGRIRTPQEIQEAYVWIREDTMPVYSGHDTSTCDPYLCLLVEILGVDVIHIYMGAQIRYSFARSRSRTTPRTLYFASDSGHFWGIPNKQQPCK